MPAPGFLFFFALYSKNPIFLSLPTEYLVDDHCYFSMASLVLYVAGDGFKFFSTALNLGKLVLDILVYIVLLLVLSKLIFSYLSGLGTAIS